jgi:hypothetical protein
VVRQLLGAGEVVAVRAHEPRGAPPQPAVADSVGAVERPGVAARGELPEHAERDPALELDGQVHQIVRQPVVVPGRGIHDQPWGALALHGHGIAALARADELDDHPISLPAQASPGKPGSSPSDGFRARPGSTGA